MRPIEIGLSLRACYSTLKDNRLLAILGDRDFSKNGIYVDFFGKSTLLPKGPSVFGYRMGSAIIPTFMIRENDDTFRLVFEEPIFPSAFAIASADARRSFKRRRANPDEEEGKAIEALTKKYLKVLESYIKAHPTQWYVFSEVWNNDDKKLLRPDSII